ncbi:hypothetical protein M8J75_012935 [Diaphorina citri]|nr:hypothetical protein M8J75_012935 [Diaphorina citri]
MQYQSVLVLVGFIFQLITMILLSCLLLRLRSNPSRIPVPGRVLVPQKRRSSQESRCSWLSSSRSTKNFPESGNSSSITDITRAPQSRISPGITKLALRSKSTKTQ